LTSIYIKLDVSDRLELVLYAYRYGLAKPPNEQT
jgi:DNA-binding CsgD family transcriptional regulator